MTLALIDPAAPAEEPACRSAATRRPSALLQRDGAHDVVVKDSQQTVGFN